MKSPKPATDNRFKKLIKIYLWNRTMLNLCSIVVAILKMETGRNLSVSGINSGHHYLPTYQMLLISDNVEFLQYCGGHFEMVTGKKFSMLGVNLGHHYLPSSNFDDIGQCWIFTAHFLYRVLAAILKMADISKILKMQNCSSNGDLSLCQILCLYHYSFRSYQH
jgi:hypothetical protein